MLKKYIKYTFGTLSLIGLLFESLFLIHIIDINNWSFLLVLKVLGNLVLLGITVLFFRSAIQEEVLSKIFYLKALAVVFIFIFFFVSCTRSLIDLMQGYKLYQGDCSLRQYSGSRYPFSNTFIRLINNNERELYIKGDLYDFLKEENSNVGGIYKCNSKVNVYYLEFSNLSLSVEKSD